MLLFQGIRKVRVFRFRESDRSGKRLGSSERLAVRLYGEGSGLAYCENVLENTKPNRTVTCPIKLTAGT